MDIKAELEAREKANIQAAVDIARRDEEINEIIAAHPEGLDLHREVVSELSKPLVSSDAASETDSDEQITKIDFRKEEASSRDETGPEQVIRPISTWLSNAALVLIGVALAVTYNVTQPGGIEPTSTAHVYYLGVNRGVRPQVTPITVEDDAALVTLVVYPAFEEYNSLSTSVAFYQGQIEQFLEAPDADWQTLQTFSNSLGSQDSLALNLPGEGLKTGIYRLQVYGELESGSPQLDREVYFRVTR